VRFYPETSDHGDLSVLSDALVVVGRVDLFSGFFSLAIRFFLLPFSPYGLYPVHAPDCLLTLQLFDTL